MLSSSVFSIPVLPIRYHHERLRERYVMLRCRQQRGSQGRVQPSDL
jgi:hypothetical protein